MVQAGRVELDEFHVGHGRTGATRHGHTVTGGDIGIGRVEIDFATAPGGQESDRRGEGLDAAGPLVQHVSAEAPVVAHVAQFLAGNQVDRQVVLENLDARLAGNRRQESALDFAAGNILGVQDAAFGMAPFLAQVQLAQRRWPGGPRVR